LIGLVTGAPAAADPTIQYRLSFPEPQHHWMQVEVVFPEVPPGPLQVRISRSSPGRYALHEFAKNVYDVQITSGAGRALTPSRPNLHQWDIDGHDGTVRVRYRIFGDRVDGTYLGIDASHAHINAPAALMWARGLDERPSRVTFEQPAGRSWTVATQLFPTADPLTFTAPNLQYLLDSPMEFGPGAIESFKAPMADGDTGEPPTIRVALHHAGTSADVPPFVDGVRRIVEQARRVFGEYPAFENQTYTFLADYLPWASGDGMEHRNSTVVSSRGSLAGSRIDLLGTVSHEFFHAWNVERIRPRSLEPFNFEDANVSGELWLAEGVTSYYDGLLMARAGLIELPALLGDLTGVVSYVMLSPATRFRTAEDMSRLAPFVDAASWIDRTNWPNTFISYYVHGAALGLGLDFAIREKTSGSKSLDDVMRLMWTRHGKPGGKKVGYVDRPYGPADVTAAIAEVAGDQAWAADLMKRHVQGHEVMEYRRLVGLAGLILKPRSPGRATLEVQTEPSPQGLRVSGPTRIGSAAYRAGLDQDDVIKTVNGQAVGTTEQIDVALRAHKPGGTVKLTFMQRGREVTADVVLDEDPRFDIVAAESAGEPLSGAQKAFRQSWLSGH
jgi:predicted metalloprotease with PDZ domain